MPLPDIQLDDRRFDDLVAELRRRIPAYTPEWTDHNDSDPGIALIQLFAWLEETALWRLNRAPDKSFVKFIELVGQGLLQPAPAKTELTFKLSSKDLQDAVLIPQGTQVSMSASDGGGPVVFETDDNLYAYGGALTVVQSFDGAQYRIQTESNRLADGSFYPLSPTPQRNSALYLGFDRAFPNGQHRLTIHSASAPVVGNVSGTPSSGTPPVIAYWEYSSGPNTWEQLTVDSDGTQNLTHTGAVLFEAPSDMVATAAGLSQAPPLFWIRFRIDQILGPGYERPPQIQDVLTNTVGATNAVTETDELLGASNGLPNQTFKLSNVPVLPKDPSVAGIIAVDEGSGFVTWTEVSDLLSYGRDDQVYTLDYSSGTVTFGDGEHGKIPHWLSDDGSNDETADIPNIKAVSYRWGGGGRGNGGPNTITTLESSIAYVDSVTNLRPSLGGQDEETVNQARIRVPQALRTQSRAVTASDFEFLATQTPGAQIRRAKALSLYNPSFNLQQPTGVGAQMNRVPVPGAVTVLIVPDSPVQPPIPSADTIALVESWLDQHRLITTELFVDSPKFRKVEVEARVTVDPSANLGNVTLDLQNRLLAFFNPLTGGPAGAGWDLGGSIYFSETYRQILITPGVLRIESQAVKTFVDDIPQPANQDIPLAENEVVYSMNHTVIASYP